MTSTRKVAVPVAGSRIWTKGSSGEMVRFSPGSSVSGGSFRPGCFFNHLAPGGRVGEAVGEAELGLQEFVDTADDVGDDGLRGVEDAALNFELFVVGGEEVLVEVDDRVFAARLVIEVGEDHFHVGIGAGEQVGDVTDAEFVEINLPLAAFDHRGKHQAFLLGTGW
jgi:hypothetical protein